MSTDIYLLIAQHHDDDDDDDDEDENGDGVGVGLLVQEGDW